MYRATSDYGSALYGEEPFEHDFTVTEERDLVASGHVEVIARTYRVLSDNFVAGKQGALIEAAYLSENEAALIAGGHIERAESPSTKKKG